MYNLNIQNLVNKFDFFKFNQAKKTFGVRLFVSVNLFDLVPADNFYRKLLTDLDLQFIYKTHPKPTLCQENGTRAKQNGRTSDRYFGKLYQHEML